MVDEIQDAVNVNSNEPCMKKIKLPNKTKFHAGVWNTGTPKKFLMHMKQAIPACDQMGLFSDYETACESTSTEDLQTVVTAGVDVTIIDNLKLVKKDHFADLKVYEKQGLMQQRDFSPSMQTFFPLKPVPTGTK